VLWVAELDKGELADIIDKTMGDKDSIKEAVDTLHPKADKKDSAQQSDRLAIFNDVQIDAAAVLTWQDKALSMSFSDFKSKNVSEGFVDKVKALTVSKEGIGRTEIPGVMQPKILGEMMQQGMMPMMNQPQPQQKKPGFFRKLFGQS
jgi:hypothetical protein